MPNAECLLTFLPLKAKLLPMFLPRTLSASVDKIAREALGKDWALYAALLDHWPEIVGSEYARATTPVKITFPPRQREAQRGGGTLVIRLPKGLAMEFTFKIGQIRERISGYFGYEAISKIVFESVYGAPDEAEIPVVEPDPQALAELHEAAKDIEDEELRGALEAFGGAVLRGATRR
jgi:hypothetical protein